MVFALGMPWPLHSALVIGGKHTRETEWEDDNGKAPRCNGKAPQVGGLDWSTIGDQWNFNASYRALPCGGGVVSQGLGVRGYGESRRGANMHG